MGCSQGSLFQHPRTAEEEALFRRGLQLSNVWYGHQQTVFWAQTQLPPALIDRLASYDVSGWCFVEAALSSVVKLSSRRLDLALRSEGVTVYGGSHWIASCRLDVVCAARRSPPPTPESVAHLLATEKAFTHKGDVSTVSELYARFFEQVSATATALDFGQTGWAATEVSRLVAVLPHFASLTSLDLSSNYELPDEACAALADAVRAHGALATLRLDDAAHLPVRALTGDEPTPALDLRSCGLRAASACVMARWLAGNPALTDLDVRTNAISERGAAALAAAVVDSRSLVRFGSMSLAELRGGASYLDLSNRSLMAAEWRVLCALLRDNESVQTLNATFNGLMPPEGLALAVAITTGAPALNSLNVRANPICDEGGDEGEQARQALRAAGAGRRGFELIGL